MAASLSHLIESSVAFSPVTSRTTWQNQDASFVASLAERYSDSPIRSIGTITNEVESHKSGGDISADLKFLFEMLNHGLDCVGFVARDESDIYYDNSDFITDATSVDAGVTFTSDKTKLDKKLVEFLVPFVWSLFKPV